MRKDTIIGPVGVNYLATIDSVLPEFKSARYSFLEAEKYESILGTNPAEAYRVYWSEILFRTHLAAATSIIRSRRWIDGILREEEDPNFLVFMAAIRGLLESAADASTAFQVVILTLTEHYRIVEDALTRRCREPHSLHVSPELEDALIHYSHATKVPKAADIPNSQRAKSMQEYLSVFEQGKVLGIREMYSALCDATHPGAASVQFLLRHKNKAEKSVGWIDPSVDSDRQAVRWFSENFGDVMPSILMFAFNPSMIALRILNAFSLSTIHTPASANWKLEGIPLWETCRKTLLRQGAKC